MLNKKGHLPTFLLFFLSLILVVVAWFSFLSFNSGINENASEIIELSANLESQKLYVERLFGESVFEAIESYESGDFGEFVRNETIEMNKKIAEVSSVDGNYFGKIRNGEVESRLNGENYTLEMKGVLVYSEIGNNRIESHFDLIVEFNESGVSSVRKEGVMSKLPR